MVLIVKCWSRKVSISSWISIKFPILRISAFRWLISSRNEFKSRSQISQKLIATNTNSIAVDKMRCCLWPITFSIVKITKLEEWKNLYKKQMQKLTFRFRLAHFCSRHFFSHPNVFRGSELSQLIDYFELTRDLVISDNHNRVFKNRSSRRWRNWKLSMQSAPLVTLVAARWRHELSLRTHVSFGLLGSDRQASRNRIVFLWSCSKHSLFFLSFICHRPIVWR